MGVRLKLIVIIAFVSLVPLGVQAYTTIALHQRAFEGQLAEVHRRSAIHGAAAVSARLNGLLSSLEALSSQIQWADLADAERDGALWLLHGQHPDLLVVALYDASGGQMGRPAYLPPDDPEPAPRLRPHAQLLQRIVSAFPLSEVTPGIPTLGEPVLTPTGQPVLPLAFAVPAGAASKNQFWTLAVALSLASTCENLRAGRPDRSRIFLTDNKGKGLCPGGLTHPDTYTRLLSTPAAHKSSARYATAEGEMLAAFATTFGGWFVVVEQSVETAFAASRRIQVQSLMWIVIAVLSAVLAGLVLARGINRPIASLAMGASELARGNFGFRLETDGDDEFTDLSNAFNYMGAEIEKRECQIRDWNRELQQRVEQRTAELKEAQGALLESRKIAAMARLGAGVAHEINNPLTSVIGLAQLLRVRFTKSKERNLELELLASLESESIRIRDIVERMLALSESHEREGFVPLALDAVLGVAVEKHADRIEAQKVQVVRNTGSSVARIIGNQDQLEMVFDQLLDNALNAMQSEPRVLEIAVEGIDGELVKVRVCDNGVGIAEENLEKLFDPFFTTKATGSGTGLGLSMVYRFVEAHNGSLKVSSTPGKGTTMSATFPVARQGAHLV